MKMGPGDPLSVALRWDAETFQPVGRLAYRDRLAYLEYDAGFLASGLDLSPVHDGPAPGLVTPQDPHVFEGLHGLFADSLPDGWGRLLLDRRARQLGVDPAALTPLDRLACVGETGVGALVYAPAVEVWDGAGEALDLDRLARDARRVLQGDAGEVVAELGRVGGSPGGARPKALIALSPDGEARHGVSETPQEFTPYLVKFRGEDDPADIAAVEQAYAQMARGAGLRISETRLIAGTDGRRYFATRRFDREAGSRLHVRSASGLLYADSRLPSLDYRELIRLTRHVTRDRREGAQMYRLAVFNVLAHNRDDHARQFSFLMDREGVWRLAPAYDLTCADGSGGEHATSVMGAGREVRRETLLTLAREADMGGPEAEAVIDQVAAALDAWPTHAEEAGVSTGTREAVAARLAAARSALA